MKLKKLLTAGIEIADDLTTSNYGKDQIHILLKMKILVYMNICMNQTIILKGKI